MDSNQNLESVCLIVVIPGDSTFEDCGGGMNNISVFLTFYNVWVKRN